jgi:hypothetical protein
MNGYCIQKRCLYHLKTICNWLIKIYLNTNEATLSCREDCQHEISEQNKKFNFFIYIYI